MTQDYTGVSGPVTVLGTATPLMADPTVPHDSILVVNQTPGTVVWFDNVNTVASGAPRRALANGETIELPWTGQVWGRAYATTGAGEALNGATVAVRPVVVSSPLQRNLLTGLGRLVSAMYSKVRGCSPETFAFDRTVPIETDLTVLNGGAFEVKTNVVNLTGRTIQIRKVGRPTDLITWIVPTVLNAGLVDQSIRFEIIDPPTAQTYDVDIVAVLGSDEAAVMRGRVKVV